MDKDLANIVTNEKQRLQGFKVLGVFPFYLNYITTGTHIKLCEIKERILAITDKEPTVEDFYNAEIQKQLIPLINQYCVIGLINGRFFGSLLHVFLNFKIKRCGHAEVLSLFFTIHKLNEPAFFLTYWKFLKGMKVIKSEEEKQ